MSLLEESKVPSRPLHAAKPAIRSCAEGRKVASNARHRSQASHGVLYGPRLTIADRLNRKMAPNVGKIFGKAWGPQSKKEKGKSSNTKDNERRNGR